MQSQLSMYPTQAALFDDFSEHHPEGKLELIDRRLIVGNSLIGSRLMLRQLLQGWRAEAAVAVASIEQWIEALREGFNLAVQTDGQNVETILDTLEQAAAAIPYEAEDLVAGWGGDTFVHHQIRQDLSMALFQVAGQVGGQSLGRDFVMQLGENGFTPDLLFFKGQGQNRLFSYYLEGPAELVIEVLRPGHEYCDRIVKRNFYETAGVSEYWMLDSYTRQTEFLRLVDGQYQQQSPDADGRYRPASIPGLAFSTNIVWNEDNPYQNWLDQAVFSVEQSTPYQRVRGTGGYEWGSLPFAPRLDLAPVPIQFEEYVSWCPEAKFEFFDGKPQIGYKTGSQHLIGLLLMTFGLASAVQVLPPQAWIAALRNRLELEQQDHQRKADWWEIARQAAELLRSQFGLTRIAVIGDLVRSQPLNYWSEITLVTWETDIPEHWKIYDALSKLSREPEISFLRAEKDYLTAEQKNAIAQEPIEI